MSIKITINGNTQLKAGDKLTVKATSIVTDEPIGESRIFIAPRNMTVGEALIEMGKQTWMEPEEFR